MQNKNERLELTRKRKCHYSNERSKSVIELFSFRTPANASAPMSPRLHPINVNNLEFICQDHNYHLFQS